MKDLISKEVTRLFIFVVAERQTFQWYYSKNFKSLKSFPSHLSCILFINRKKNKFDSCQTYLRNGCLFPSLYENILFNIFQRILPLTIFMAL